MLFSVHYQWRNTVASPVYGVYEYNLYPPLWTNKILLLPDHANNKMGSLKGVFSINGNV